MTIEAIHSRVTKRVGEKRQWVVMEDVVNVHYILARKSLN